MRAWPHSFSASGYTGELILGKLRSERPRATPTALRTHTETKYPSATGRLACIHRVGGTHIQGFRPLGKRAVRLFLHRCFQILGRLAARNYLARSVTEQKRNAMLLATCKYCCWLFWKHVAINCDAQVRRGRAKVIGLSVQNHAGGKARAVL